MWFDPRAKLAEILASPATSAAKTGTFWPWGACDNCETERTARVYVAEVANVATPSDPELIRDFLEERAAILEFDGGQSQAKAEAGALNDVTRSAGITADKLSQLWQISRQA